jgi:hypothetical protein
MSRGYDICHLEYENGNTMFHRRVQPFKGYVREEIEHETKMWRMRSMIFKIKNDLASYSGTDIESWDTCSYKYLDTSIRRYEIAVACVNLIHI